MTTVQVSYHYEDGEGWWADSDALPGWTAIGATFEEVRTLVREGVREFVGDTAIVEELGVPFMVSTTTSGFSSGTIEAGWSAGMRMVFAVSGLPMAPRRTLVVPSKESPVQEPWLCGDVG